MTIEKILSRVLVVKFSDLQSENFLGFDFIVKYLDRTLGKKRALTQCLG